MARNNDLVVTAGLNVEASVAQIEKDLKQVNDKLSADHALKIIANVDLSKTTQRIQSQLTTLSKNLKLDIGGFAFDKNIDNAVSVIQNSLSNIKTGIKIPVDIDEDVIDNVGDSLKNLGLKSKDIERLTKYFQDLDVVITKIKPKFVELSGSGGEKVLDSLSISGVDKKTGGIINIVDQLDNIEGKTAKTTYTITQNLAKVEQENKKIEDSAKAAQLAYNDFLKLKGQADVYSKQYAGEDNLKTQLADIQKLIGEFDNTQPLEKQREGIINIDNALKLLKVDIDNIKKASTPVVAKGASDFYPNIVKGASTQDTISNAKNTLNELFAKTAGMEEDTANRVKRAVEDTTGALQRFYVQVERGDKSVETLTYALNEQGNAYEYLGKTIREADNSTDFRRKDITTQWDIQTQKLQQFITNAEKAGAASTVLSDDIANLKIKLDSKGDTSAMNSFLDDFDIAKAKFQAFNAEVRKENATANLQNRIRRLTADVNAYGEANERATKSMKQMSNGNTFAVEWSRITTEMAKGADLTDRELKDLSADMAVFRKEAQAAGLAGESAFGKFINSFKTMSSYITANMVFNFVKRQLRDMVQEVTAVDTAMVELRKVTEATDEQFEAFARSAGQTGRELGASVSDVINATSTFSRAGFSLPEAEELGRIATLYKNVGDGIDIEGASESIISVMKAFNIEAEESERIIDRINKVSNNFAIDSQGLGFALQRVASAMRAANNTLDETIALTTVANEIVQNPEMVAQGWRTVALRIRGAKTELQDAGLETDGMVESTAKLRDLVKGISGVDIMLDENTFKSTYQIIEELGRVWDKISDIDQASLLEAIAGKRQSNIVAAALTNYDRLDDVLQTSINSMGSARAEQEEYAKSIQYSIDTLKAAYQDFADSVINSDFVKNLLGTAQSFLEVLTKIIDKFGTLPTILTGIAAIGGIKGVGIFGNFDNGLKSILSTFEKIKQVANYDFGKLYKIYEIGDIKTFSAKDIQSLQTYVNLLNKGAVSTEQFNEIFADASEEVIKSAKGFEKLNKAFNYGVVSEKEYAAATQDLSLYQKTATTTTKALNVALNTLANVGIMIAINLAIKGISTLVDKLVITKDELNEIRQNSVESIKELSDSIDELVEKEAKVDDLLEQYQKIAFSTDDITKSKDELLTIQNDIIEQFGAEKNSLDLLNDSYDTTIAKIKELSDEEFKRWKRKNAERVSELEDVESLNVRFTGNAVLNDEITSLDLDASNPSRYSSRLNELYESYYVIKDIDKEITDVAKNIDGIGVSYSGFFKDSLSLSGDIREAYSQLGELLDAIDESGLSVSVAELSERYEVLGDVIAEIDNISQREQEHEASNIKAVGNAIVTNIDNLKQYTSTLKDSRSEWFETLKEFQEESENTVGKISKAIQSIADGDKISSKDFWELIELDTNHILTDIQLVGDEFVVSQEQLINLKDEYIDKQVESLKFKNAEIEKQKEDLKVAIERAKVEMAILGSKGLGKEALAAQRVIEQAERALGELEEQQMRNNALINEANSRLGDTADYVKRLKNELEALNNDLDNYVKAFEYRIDRNINGLQEELDILNEQKDAMQAELDVLNEQKDAIQETIDNYKTVADLVQDVVEKRKEELEAEKKSIEDTYNERINRLKEETEQREDAFEYAQKLANLENAKNNKRRVYDEARGWRYESVKEDVVKAENDLAKFENEREIKSLEKERDELTKTIDKQIEEQTKYAEYYKETIDGIILQEKELIAEQILGSEWRTDIANLDIKTAEKFRTEYNNHNTSLQNIVRNEIKLKEAAIKAKDAEIKSKQEQIESWKKYKTNVQNAVKDVKEAQEGYMTVVNQLDSEEPLTLDNRATAFEKFRDRVVTAIGNITSLQSQIEGVTSSLNGDHTYTMSFNVENQGDIDEANSTLGQIQSRFDGIADVAMRNFMAFNKQEGVVTWGSNDRSYSGAWGSPEIFGSHANGGVADYTGLAMLHGTKQRSETIFNANDSAKLYEMVHETPNLMADMLNQATKLSGFKLSSNENTTNSTANTSIYIDKIVTNNPEDFARQLDRYYRTKLTESYTSRQ